MNEEQEERKLEREHKKEMKELIKKLTCDCGYKKVVQNPFGGKPQSRDEAAFARLQNESKKKQEVEDGSP